MSAKYMYVEACRIKERTTVTDGQMDGDSDRHQPY